MGLTLTGLEASNQVTHHEDIEADFFLFNKYTSITHDDTITFGEIYGMSLEEATLYKGMFNNFQCCCS